MPQPKSHDVFELPIEGFELSFEGSLSPGRLAKLLETLRWRLARRGDHPILGSFRAGVLRAQTLALESDVRMGETLRVELWLSRVGRTSLEFSHTLTRGDGSSVGRATATIVALGDAGPAPLPESLKQFVERPGTLASPPLELPDPAKSYVHRFRIRPSDLDLFRHVNQSRYVDFLDDARLLAHHDGHEAGFSGPAGLASVSYESELKLGELVEVLLERRDDGSRRFGIRRAGDERLTTKGMIVPRDAGGHS
jgi:acyl-CoA thioesterase FadM